MGIGIDRQGNTHLDGATGILRFQVEPVRVGVDFKRDAGRLRRAEYGVHVEVGRLRIERDRHLALAGKLDLIPGKDNRLALRGPKLYPSLIGPHRLAEATLRHPDPSQGDGAIDCVGDAAGLLQMRHALSIPVVGCLEIPSRPVCELSTVSFQADNTILAHQCVVDDAGGQVEVLALEEVFGAFVGAAEQRLDARDDALRL